MIDWFKNNWQTALVAGFVAILILWGLVGCESEAKPAEEAPVVETPAVEEVIEEVIEEVTPPAVEEEVAPVEEESTPVEEESTPVEEIPAVPTEEVVE